MPRTALLSARQAAAQLGVSKAYACRLFAKGAIPALKVDTDWVVAEKDVRKYLDDKNGVPVYYRDTEGWERGDFYFLYRTLDKMVHDRRGRYSRELGSMREDLLGKEARAMLGAMGAYESHANLGGTKDAPAVSPPLVLTEYPSAGQFPAFERYGLIL